MEQALKVMAEHFNKHHIMWGVGASVLLKFHGIVKTTHDIDIIIHEADIDLVLSILDEIGTKLDVPYKAEYKTKAFFHYSILGTEVDFMSEFIIEHEAGIYTFPFDALSITDYGEIDQCKVPYTSLEDWFVAYHLMVGREKKVDMIKSYFMKHGIKHANLLQRALSQSLTDQCKEDIINLLDQK